MTDKIKEPTRGFILDIEKETLANTDYRRVLYTAHNVQLVLMSLKPGEEIGEEVHKLDQFIRVEDGEATVILDGEEHPLSSDHAVIVPAGTKHNVINTGDEDLKLYTLYAPPEHKDGLVEKTKADEHEEHFDGVVSPGAS
jgi:mannose-6-phosphate isomerase-like protein (cupin superfamily)